MCSSLATTLVALLLLLPRLQALAKSFTQMALTFRTGWLRT
jgi:hypothetical protein